jgi:hypothetical protein
VGLDDTGAPVLVVMPMLGEPRTERAMEQAEGRAP